MEIAVCDDNKLFLAEIEEQLQTLSIVDNISAFNDLDTFLFSIDGGKRYDVVLMDIEWSNKAAGMDTATELYKLCPETKIIYVTGHVDMYSQQIFLNKANLSGYLTKPVNIELLLSNLQKVADAMPYHEQPALVLRSEGTIISIPMREIFYIQSQNHNIVVHTAGETVTVYERLGSIMRSLPGSFFKCHKSYIVNMNQIRRFQSGDILLKNGELVPVSRLKYRETKKAYFNFMGQTF